jgi:hypothetical protein
MKMKFRVEKYTVLDQELELGEIVYDKDSQFCFVPAIDSIYAVQMVEIGKFLTKLNSL